MRSILAFFLIILICGGLYAQDWKKLHDRSAQLSLHEIEKLAVDSPDSFESLYMLGLAYLELFRNDDARKVFDKLVVLYPDSVGARWGRAEVLRRFHKARMSEQIFNEIHTSHPDFYPVLISLGYMRYTQTEFRKAIELAKDVLARGRNAVDARNYIRALLIIAGSKGLLAQHEGPVAKIVHGTRVLSYIRKAEEIDPTFPAVKFALGSFYLLAPPVIGGDTDKAIELISEAIKLNPLFTDPYVRLAQAYLLKDDVIKYHYYLKKALQLDSGNFLALDIKNGTCKFACLPQRKKK